MNIKIKLNSKEADFLQEVINIICAYNRCDKAFVATFFKGRESALDTAYLILDGTLIYSLADNKIYDREIAFEKLCSSGVELFVNDYSENIFATQANVIKLGSANIRPAQDAIVDIDEESMLKSKRRIATVNKLLIILVIVNCILLAVNLYQGDGY